MTSDDRKVRAIIGPPGTGKTERVARLVAAELESPARAFGDAGRLPVAVCSLTRAAAAEAAARVSDMPIDRDAVGTIHSFAYRALGAPQIAESYAADFRGAWQLRATRGVDPDDPLDRDAETQQSPGDVALQQYQRLRAITIPRDRWPANVVGFAAAWEQWKSAEDLLDFNDLLETAARDCPVCPGDPRHVVIDEAQDCSRLMLDLAHAWAANSDRLTIVGDAWQSLYEWAGACPGMFSDPRVGEPEVLAQSYRVPRAVHRAATKWVRRLTDWRPIDYNARDGDGAVGCIAVSYREPRKLLAAICPHMDAGSSVIVCAPCAYHLRPLIGELRAAAIPFSNPWRSKRGDWNPLGRRKGTTMTDRVRALVPSGAERRPWTRREIAAWTEPIEAHGTLKRGAKKAIKSAAEEVPTAPVVFEQLLQWFEPNALDQLWDLAHEKRDDDALVDWWQARLLHRRRDGAAYVAKVMRRKGIAALDAPSRLYVGTIHSFKGAEADVVVVIPDLSRQGYREWSHPTTRDAVVRVGYVAMTRARERLYVCRGADSRCMPIKEVLG